MSDDDGSKFCKDVRELGAAVEVAVCDCDVSDDVGSDCEGGDNDTDGDDEEDDEIEGVLILAKTIRGASSSISKVT